MTKQQNHLIQQKIISSKEIMYTYMNTHDTKSMSS